MGGLSVCVVGVLGAFCLICEVVGVGVLVVR